MRLQILPFLWMGFLLVGSTQAFASLYYVEKAKYTSGANRSDAEVVEELVRNHVAADGSQRLTSETKDADFILQPKLVKLGGSYSVTIEKKERDQVVFSSSLKAQRIEDMDAIVGKLVYAVINEQQVQQTVNVMTGQSSEQSVASEPRRESLNRPFIHFGPSIFSPNVDGDVSFTLGGGYSWDLGRGLVKALTELSFGGTSGINYMELGLGGDFFLKDTDTAPFLGGEFGYGFARKDPSRVGEDTLLGGLLIGATGGIQFFRRSNVNLEIALKINLLTTEVGGGVPVIYGFRAGLYF